MAIVNACSALGSRTIKFQADWYLRAGVSRKTGQRSLAMLAQAGVIAIERDRGMMPTITLSELVPLSERTGK